MSEARRSPRSILAAVAAGLLCVGAAWAQQSERAALTGRVVDGGGRPVGGAVVAVHRVSAAGGAEIARTTTGEDGRFELPLETRGDGIYFATTRYADGLYVGPQFRRLVDAPADYEIVVGVDPVAAAAPATLPPPGTASNPWPLMFLIGVLAAGAVTLPLATRRRRPYAVRSLLHELAELEERHAGEQSDLPGYEVERTALRARIRELSGATR